MDDNSGQPGSAQTGTLPRTALPRAITGWIRAGTLDAELAALTSILIESGLPLVVAASGDASGQAAGREWRRAMPSARASSAVPPSRGPLFGLHRRCA